MARATQRQAQGPAAGPSSPPGSIPADRVTESPAPRPTEPDLPGADAGPAGQARGGDDRPGAGAIPGRGRPHAHPRRGPRGWSHLEVGAETEDVVTVAGRVMFVRNTGKLCFAILQEGVGTRLRSHALARRGRRGRPGVVEVPVDLGDHVAVTGRVVSSRRSELGSGDFVGDGQQGAASAPHAAQGPVRGDPRQAAVCRPRRPPGGRDMVRLRAAVTGRSAGSSTGRALSGWRLSAPARPRQGPMLGRSAPT